MRKLASIRFRFRRDDIILHVSSVSLGLFAFYSVVFVANLLRIPFYLGYEKYAMNIIVLSAEADRVLWLGSTVLFLATSFFRGLRGGFDVFKLFFDRYLLVLSLFYLMLLLMAVEIASLACWLHNLFSPSPLFVGGGWHFAFVEAQLTSILYPVLPVLLMFFAYSWVGEFVFKGLMAGNEEGRDVIDDSFLWFGSRWVSAVISAFSVFSAFFLCYYNYAVAGVCNPGFPGVDVPHYAKWLNGMLNSTSVEALIYASKNDRFLYLVLQYICCWLVGLPSDAFVAYFMPVVLLFLLMFSSFFFVRTCRDLFHASTAMLVSVFSFQVTVGFYAGFFANWFALFFVYMFYGLLLRVLERRGRGSLLLLLSGVSSVAVLYTHPWTWILLVMVILSAYAVTTLLIAYFRRGSIRGYGWELKVVSVLLIFNLVMFYVKGLLGVGGGARLGGYVDVRLFKPSVWNVFLLKYFLDKTFNWYVGGFYACAPAIILAILGVFSIFDYADRGNRLLLDWMLIASAMAFVNFPWQARFLYLMPFNIYVAYGILYGAGWLSRFLRLKGHRCLAVAAFWILYVLSILLLMNYAFRCVSIKQYGSAGITGIKEY